MTPGAHRDGYNPYALDNGAWTAFKQGTAFDENSFQKLVARYWENVFLGMRT